MKITPFLLISVTFALVGCNNTLPEDDDTHQVVNGMKVSIGDKSITNGELGLYMRAEESYSERSNARYTYHAGAWRATVGEEIAMNLNSAHWGVYYPYDQRQEDSGTSIHLSPSVRSPLNPRDTWFGHYTSDKNTDFTTLALTLKQVYSRIKFTFVRSNSYKENVFLYGFLMKDIYIASKLDVTVPDGKYENKLGSEQLYYYGDLPIGPEVFDGEQPSAVLDILLIPQQLTSPIYITVTLAEWDATSGGLVSRTMSHAIQPSAFEESRIKAGAVYEMTVIVSGRDISTTGAFLRKEEWKFDGNSLGDMTEIIQD